MQIAMKLDDLLKQAKSMQVRMGQATEDLKASQVTGESGAGMVKVTLNGAYEALRVEIDPMTTEEDRSVLEDLLAAAINDAVRRVEALHRERMGEVARGLSLPTGFSSPTA